MILDADAQAALFHHFRLARYFLEIAGILSPLVAILAGLHDEIASCDAFICRRIRRCAKPMRFITDASMLSGEAASALQDYRWPRIISAIVIVRD